MFLRAYRVCSPEFFQNEIDKIFEISRNLKYPQYFVQNALQKAKKTFYSLSTNVPYDNKNVLVLPYSNSVNNVTKFCKDFNINVVFRFSNTLKNFLIKNSPKNSLGCIYRIPCVNCDHFYIGQSGKGIATRIKQHKYSVRTGQMSNALFLHMNNFNHAINWVGSDVLLYCNNIIKRNIIESALIKNGNNLMNVSQGIYKLDPFIVKEISRLVLS